MGWSVTCEGNNNNLPGMLTSTISQMSVNDFEKQHAVNSWPTDDDDFAKGFEATRNATKNKLLVTPPSTTTSSTGVFPAYIVMIKDHLRWLLQLRWATCSYIQFLLWYTPVYTYYPYYKMHDAVMGKIVSDICLGMATKTKWPSTVQFRTRLVAM